MTHTLDAATASRFASAALGHVTLEYPNKLDHVMTGRRDVRGPRDLHPIFFGSFDWHSCVHGWWTLFTPASVSDRSDGKIAHLDGLNLSRAWCWREIASALPEDDIRAVIADRAAATHLDAALPHVTGDYMGEHWLASFALLALLETG